MDTLRWQKALRFVLLTFLFSWGLVALFILLNRDSPVMPYTALAVVYMFMPMLAAIILTKIKDKGSLKRLGLSFKLNRYFVLAWLFPVILLFITIGINLLFPGVNYDPSLEGIIERTTGQLSEGARQMALSQLEQYPIHPFWLGLISGLLAGVTVNALAAFGEEYGWRGYLLNVLEPLGFWKASLIIGLIWGIWHAPMILFFGHNYPVHRLAGVGMMVIFCILLSFFHTYVRLKSGSVIAASILHGTLNALAGLPLLVIQGGNDLTNGLTGLAGFIALFLLTIPLLWGCRKSLQKTQM